MFLLGMSVGIIVSMIGAMVWGYRLSIREEEHNKALMKELADKYIDNMQTKEMKL